MLTHKIMFYVQFHKMGMYLFFHMQHKIHLLSSPYLRCQASSFSTIPDFARVVGNLIKQLKKQA